MEYFLYWWNSDLQTLTCDLQIRPAAITLKFKMCLFLDEASYWAEKLLPDINLPPLMPGADNNFQGSLALDLENHDGTCNPRRTILPSMRNGLHLPNESVTCSKTYSSVSSEWFSKSSSSCSSSWSCASTCEQTEKRNKIMLNDVATWKHLWKWHNRRSLSVRSLSVERVPIYPGRYMSHWPNLRESVPV